MKIQLGPAFCSEKDECAGNCDTPRKLVVSSRLMTVGSTKPTGMPHCERVMLRVNVSVPMAHARVAGLWIMYSRGSFMAPVLMRTRSPLASIDVAHSENCFGGALSSSQEN